MKLLKDMKATQSKSRRWMSFAKKTTSMLATSVRSEREHFMCFVTGGRARVVKRTNMASRGSESPLPTLHIALLPGNKLIAQIS